MPPRIKRLPVDKRGFPVPKFVAIIDGEPDHRVVNAAWFGPATRHRLCWLCGEPMGRYYTSIIGCMCSVNRIISEPPSHRDCAEWAVRGCPFLSRPHAHRREAGLPEDARDAAGEGLKRNPGVVCLWISREYPTPTKVWAGNEGVLYQLKDPIETIWYREGRLATRQEVIDAIDEGLPTLMDIAKGESQRAVEALKRMTKHAMHYLPAAA
jgi:hypothetical protein